MAYISDYNVLFLQFGKISSGKKNMKMAGI